MAQVVHTAQSLKDISDDLTGLVARIEALRKRMMENEIEGVGIDGEKGQVNGRTALLGFVASGEQALRRAMDEIYLRDVEKKPRR